MGINGSLGTVLQGVSQQQPRIRLPGQVTEQINIHSDVVKGAVSRPPVVDIAVLGTEATAMEFDDIQIDGVVYIVGFHAGGLRVWDTTGAEFTLVTQDADAVNYIGDNMGFHVYDDTIYVTNRDITVTEDNAIDTSDVMLGQGIVQCLGGSFGRNYLITINYSDGASGTGTYNVPDTDPDKVNGDDIMSNLIDDATLGFDRAGNLKGTTTVTLTSNVMLVTDSAFTFTLTVSDGDDGKVLRQHVKQAKTIEDLSKWAPHGTLVKVEGEEVADDDFYMRFEVEDETTVGDGFGENGLWRESVDYEEARSMDFKTTPHIIFKNGETFYFERNLWNSRRAGNAESNPHPSFVGHKVTDIGGFQSRLMFTAGPNNVGSRTNFPADFYSKSVFQEIDSDPVDFSSTTESEVDLRFMVPFDRDMLLMSNKHQFIVSGLTPLTPGNAAMVQTTDFEMAGEARPSSTGRTILFPYTIGAHAGLKEFFASDEIATNGADNLTKLITTYIQGEVTQIATTTNFGVAVLRTDGASAAHILWVYKYLWDDNEIKKIQSSWSKWEFPLDVHGMFWVGSKLFVIMRDGNDYSLGSMDLDFAPHAVGFLPTLDRQTDEVADSSSEVTLEYADAVFVQHTGCSDPGTRATPTGVTGSGPYVYAFDTTTVPSAATVVAGLVYTSSITPTMPFRRARDGKTKRLDAVVVTDFHVAYEDSGFITATRSSRYRAVDQVIDNRAVIEADDPEDLLQIGIRSGTFSFPWGERSDWSELTLHAADIRPIQMLEIDWEGQSFTRGQRVS